MKGNIKNYFTIGAIFVAVVFVLPALTKESSQPASVTAASKQSKETTEAEGLHAQLQGYVETIGDSFLSAMDLTDKVLGYFTVR